MSDQRIVFFLFAGREENLLIQRPFLDRLLAMYRGAEVHYWNLTRNEEDNQFVRGLHDPDARVHVLNDFWPGDNTWPVGCRKKLKRPKRCECRDCRPAPYEKVYQWYAERPEFAGTVFTKLDDDVLFIQTGTYSHVLEELAEHPNAVVSACAVNNVVSAKHTPRLRKRIEDRFSPETQRDWFDLHTSGDFARISHDWFLQEAPWCDHCPPDCVRALPGERPSINCISFTHDTMVRLADAMRHLAFRKIGDEGTVCHNFLPRIMRSFVVAHLQFGPQRVAVPEEEWDTYREAYRELAAEYLGE